jgi:hypothetical protein
METSANPILGTDLTRQAFNVGLYKFFTAKNTLYKDRESRPEQHIVCARYPVEVQGNLRVTLARRAIG